MTKNIPFPSEIAHKLSRYHTLLRYLYHIHKTGKIKQLTRSQIRALQMRLANCQSAWRKILKLAFLAAGVCATAPGNLNAQCKMNRLPISTQTSFTTLGTLSKPTFVDIDQDGDMDLVMGFNFGTLTTYLNRDGLFRKAYGVLDRLTNVLDGRHLAPVFVDIDQDGDMDAFVGEYYGNIRFYRNTNGIFSYVNGAANPFDGISVGDDCTPAFVDIDQDGDMDAFVGASNGTIHYFRNDNGTLTKINGSENPFNGIDVGSFSAPAFVDIDQDGDMDAYIGGHRALNFFRNQNGVFTSVNSSDDPLNLLSFSGDYASPCFGDLDDDGDEDLFIGLRSGTIASFINSDGIFNQVTGASNPFNGIDVGILAKPVLIDIDPTDSDTELDLVVGSYDGTIRYYRNNNGSFALLTGLADPFAAASVGSDAAPTFVDYDGDNDKDAFVGASDGTIHYFRNSGGIFVEVTGSGNPFNGIDVGNYSTPSFFRFDASRALIGNRVGEIREFKKVGNQYQLVTDSPFQNVELRSAAPTMVDISPEYSSPGYSGREVVIGNRDGGLLTFSDQGGRTNVWQGPFNSHWHGFSGNWELMTIPKAGCDEVHVLDGFVLKVNSSQIGEAGTLTVRKGGQFEIQLGAQLHIDP